MKGIKMTDDNNENDQNGQEDTNPITDHIKTSMRFYQEVMLPLAGDVNATERCIEHFTFPSDEPIPRSNPIKDGEKDENRIYVIYYPPEGLTTRPTGHMALAYKGKMVDLYPANIGLDSTNMTEALTVCLRGGGKREKDTEDGTLHAALSKNTRVIAISPKQLKDFYRKHLHMPAEIAQKNLDGLERRISSIRGKIGGKPGWKNWLVMGSEKAGNCTDGVRYVLGFPRRNSTFLGRENGLALPSSMYRYLINKVVNTGHGTLVTPEYFSRVKFNQKTSDAEHQGQVAQVSLRRNVSTR